MLKLCGETQEKLAHELILFELTIERDVVEPLYDLAEVQKHTEGRTVALMDTNQTNHNDQMIINYSIVLFYLLQ